MILIHCMILYDNGPIIIIGVVVADSQLLISVVDVELVPLSLPT